MKQKFQPRLQKAEVSIPAIFLHHLGSSSSSSCISPPVSPQRKLKKKVSFNQTVRVMLIPSRDEYDEAELSRSLWYNRSELMTIEKSALVPISTGKLFEEVAEDSSWSFLPHVPLDY
jgi:hypothetical protein